MLNPTEIIYIEAFRHNIQIVTRQNKYVTSTTLSSLEAISNNYSFFRCHKSFLVNFQYIHSYNSQKIVLKNCSFLYFNKTYISIYIGIRILDSWEKYDGCNTMSGECFISTKKDPGHGFGLRSIKSAVESCNGTVRFDEDKDKFKLTIMLPYDNRAHA